MVKVKAVLEFFEMEGEEIDDLFWACCPVHPENSPSWKIHLEGPRRGQFFCFGCKWRGDVYTLVMEKLGMSFPGAKAFIEGLPEELAKNIPIVVYKPITFEKPRTFALPHGVYQLPLHEWISVARDYALARHLTGEQVERWRIGYAVGGRLDGRIVIPVYNAQGTLLSYTGRTFAGDPKRYLEPHESERPDQDAIFGEEHWPPKGERRHTLIHLEGALNGLAVERVRPDLHFGALMGSDVSLGQLNKLHTWKRHVLLTDPDIAGDLAARKLLGALGRHAEEVVRTRLRAGADPDNMPPAELQEVLAWLPR